MEEIEGYIGERDGVRVIVTRKPYSDKSGSDAVRIAIDLLRDVL